MSDSAYDRGMRVRRRVLGDAHVDRSWENASEFDSDFQRFITEVAWGSVWSRDGLDLKTRHMVTISILAALGREGELALHIGASPNTGITPAEMREVLLHVAAYGGIPAANAAFGIARKVYSQKEGSDPAE
jgi:4-carboxymuconolactone decarboxylase